MVLFAINNFGNNTCRLLLERIIGSSKSIIGWCMSGFKKICSHILFSPQHLKSKKKKIGGHVSNPLNADVKNTHRNLHFIPQNLH